MRCVGEKIVYGGVGLMEIVDVREESFADVPRKYYVLREVSSSSDSQTFVPVDNQRLTSSMYPILTKEEACSLLSRISSIRCLEWHNDNRIRAEKFKAIIDSGNREGLLSLIKTVHEANSCRRKEGKKKSLADENALRKAEKLLYSELAEVLDITEAEVAEMIMTKFTY